MLGAAAGAGATPASPHLQFAVGKISTINRTRIAIGHVSCRIGPRMFVSGFFVGERAVIACVRSELEKIEHGSPAMTGPVPPSGGSVQGAPGTPGTSGNVSSSSVSNTSSSVSNSSSSVSSSASSSSTSSSSSSGGTTVTTSSSVNGVPGTQATGVVSALSSTSITVGGLTCSIGPHVLALIGNAVAVGDTASISCNNGALAALAVGTAA
jgi:hypothetical protein